MQGCSGQVGIASLRPGITWSTKRNWAPTPTTTLTNIPTKAIMTSVLLYRVAYLCDYYYLPFPPSFFASFLASFFFLASSLPSFIHSVFLASNHSIPLHPFMRSYIH